MFSVFGTHVALFEAYGLDATIAVNDSKMFAPNPPLGPTQIECISLFDNGDVMLQWEPLTDPSGITFLSYDIYTVQNGLLQSIGDISIENYTHLGADAINNPKDYYMVVRSNSGGIVELHSDTLKPIILQLASEASGGVARLQWNNPIDEKPDRFDDYYHIYRRYSVGIWELIDSVSYGTTLYRDTVDLCEDVLDYQIRLPNENGSCFSVSNVRSGTFKDRFSPPKLITSSASVDPTTGLTEINWEESDADDTQGYIVYENTSGFWVTVDTVYGKPNTSYVNTSSDPSSGPETYAVSAFDSCFAENSTNYQTSPLSTPHTTIHLMYDIFVCDRTISLNWTKYSGWDTEFDYEIHLSLDGGPYSVIATLDSAKREYVIENIDWEREYCIYVMAVSPEGNEARSNPACDYIAAPGAPDFIYVQTATVVTNDEIDVRVHIDMDADVESYYLERYNPAFEDYELIDSLPPGTDPTLFFTDINDVDADARSYTYRVVARDSCGGFSAYSNEAKTIHLRAYPNETQLVNVLNWNTYGTWNGRITGYNIYRGVDGVFSQFPIASVSPAIRAYEDPVDDELNSLGKFCYRIEAVEQLNSYDIAETSFSNIACVDQEILIFVPNALYLGGINNEFKPVISFFDYSDYEMTIYDRWGRAVFKTRDVNEGWIGQGQDHALIPEGVYIYFITVKNSRGEDVQRRGTVTLLHYSN